MKLPHGGQHFVGRTPGLTGPVVVAYTAGCYAWGRQYCHGGTMDSTAEARRCPPTPTTSRLSVTTRPLSRSCLFSKNLETRIFSRTRRRMRAIPCVNVWPLLHRVQLTEMSGARTPGSERSCPGTSSTRAALGAEAAAQRRPQTPACSSMYSRGGAGASPRAEARADARPAPHNSPSTNGASASGSSLLRAAWSSPQG